MRTLGLLLALLMCQTWPAHAQETEPPEGARISSALVSGLDLGRLSPGLRKEIEGLVGSGLDRRRLGELAARIEAEQPRHLAAIRTVQDPDGGARVVFVVARIRDEDRDPNVNVKYIVENVAVRGVPDRDLSAEIQADLNALAGKPLDSEVAERLDARLKQAFPDYDVMRRMARGSQSGRVTLIYELRRSEASRWLRFEPTPPSLVYHSDQGWGALVPLSISGGDVRIEPIFAFDHADDLIEEYSGVGIRLESRRLGTDRLGASFEWTNYDLDWRDATVSALGLDPAIPALYRNRSTVTPRVRFAITPRISVAGGVSITELDPLETDPFTNEPLPAVLPSRMANAFIGSISFDQRWKPASDRTHGLDAAFSVRAGSTTLESDLVYKRYLGSADYLYRWGRHRVLVSGMAGGIRGDAPLFERFTLGDSRTLRGWDKYDIAPVGGTRMFHLSAEYQYRGLALFLDSGSVWNAGADRRNRVSAGFGFHPGPAFFTVGFPLNTDELRAVFTMGLRFSAGVRASR